MKRTVKQWLMLLAAGLLAAFGVTARADEVLYWMVDNPTITSWYNVQKTVSEMGIEGARVAAFKTSDTAAYFASRTGTPGAAPSLEYDVVYLDMYFADGEGNWIVDRNADPRINVAEIPSGKDSMVGLARASVGTLGDVKYSDYSFAVELYTWDSSNEAWVFAAMSESETYAALTDYRGDQVDFPSGWWTPGAFAAPEPTSGMLSLIGLALLALKRKEMS